MKVIKLSLLETFFAVYKYLSLTKASVSLKCTPSNLSQKIQRLEKLLGCILFVKHKKSLVPTKEAHQLYEKTYKHFHSLETEINSLSHGQDTQHIEILTSTGASLIWLLDQINIFKNNHTNFTFSVHTTEENIPTALADFDIIALPQNLETLKYKKIAMTSFTTRLYASTDYLEKFGVPKTSKCLDKHRLISFYHKGVINRGDPDWHLRVGRPPADPRQPYLTVNNMMGVGQAVASGIGIAALTDNNPFISSHNLISILPELSRTSSTLYIFYNPLLKNSPFIKELIKDAEQ